jgi:cytochrome bd-type quinol oxidase subunit 2
VFLTAVSAIAFAIESRHSPERKDFMKLLRRFLNIVPKTVQFWAVVTVGCAVLIGLVTGYKASDQGAALRAMSLDGSAALVLGIVLAIWLLCLGFVFADARRRDMRSVLWVLVAALFPHLLGFLLYFVMRYPIAATCTHCGMTVSNHQRFCSWCGTAQFPLNSTKGPLTANPSQGVNQ